MLELVNGAVTVNLFISLGTLSNHQEEEILNPET